MAHCNTKGSIKGGGHSCNLECPVQTKLQSSLSSGQHPCMMVSAQLREYCRVGTRWAQQPQCKWPCTRGGASQTRGMASPPLFTCASDSATSGPHRLKTLLLPSHLPSVCIVGFHMKGYKPPQRVRDHLHHSHITTKLVLAPAGWAIQCPAPLHNFQSSVDFQPKLSNILNGLSEIGAWLSPSVNHKGLHSSEGRNLHASEEESEWFWKCHTLFSFPSALRCSQRKYYGKLAVLSNCLAKSDSIEFFRYALFTPISN